MEAASPCSCQFLRDLSIHPAISLGFCPCLWLCQEFANLNGCRPIEIVDLPIKNVDLPIKNVDLPMKHVDLPMKHVDLPISLVIFLVRYTFTRGVTMVIHVPTGFSMQAPCCGAVAGQLLRRVQSAVAATSGGPRSTGAPITCEKIMSTGHFNIYIYVCMYVCNVCMYVCR